VSGQVGSSNDMSRRDPLLATKLSVPPARPDLVPRPRLRKRLNEGSSRRLTLICAPAGFGKTTLTIDWLASVEQPVAWLALDESDNDPARFITYLVAALQTVDAEIGQRAQAMLRAPQPPQPEALLTGLINDIAATPTPLVLVLDDYHLIHTLPIHQQLAFLLAHHPPSMHLVIVSREDPPLPLSRLRAQGHMTEVRQESLRFTEEETADFLGRIAGLELSSADLDALYRRTEGWVAGLQLAALSLRRRDDVRQFVDSFTGSDRYVLDYLIEEVFEQQSAEVQDFLMRTSILDRFTASLCDVVAEREDSRDLLLALERANLFVIPLDRSRQWYRYHRLFADLLRHRLDMDSSLGAARLHQLASRWYVGHGFAEKAVDHALLASDWEQAAALILDVDETMLKRGEVMTLLGWLQALPDEVFRRYPGLSMSHSWALILTGQLDAAESLLAEAERVAQLEGSGDSPGAALADILSAQAFIARTRGDDQRTITLSQRALSVLPPDNLEGRSVVAVNLGIAHWSSGHLEDADEALREAEQAARQSGNQYARLTALGFLGAVRAAQGKLHEASEWLRQAIRAGAGLPPTALAHDTLGAVLYEWNDLEAAVEQLERGVEAGERSGNVDTQIGGYRILARIRQAQGDAPGALDALQKAHRLAREKDVSPLMRARNAACHVQIALAQDDLSMARRWAHRVTEDCDGSRLYPLLGLTPARLLLAEGEKVAAAEELKVWYETAARAGWRSGVIEVRGLQALAAPALDEALTFLEEALAIAEPEGFVRVFVDKGRPMAQLLREAAVRGPSPAYARRLLESFPITSTPSHPPAQPLIEPLSDRELDVLRLLVEHMTNQEIAGALFISINTVKSHLTHIYGKLGVHDRREAVDRAEELGLLT